MAFMTLKTIFFPKKIFYFAIFFLLSFCFLVSLITVKYDIILFRGRRQKGLMSQNLIFLKSLL